MSGITAEKKKGSHRAFEDLSTFLSCTAEECVFCRTKQLANKEHLRHKHLKEAVYFSDQGKEKFVVACYCKDASTNSKRSHYHCPFCQYRSFSRNFNFTKHLQALHGITAEKKKGGKDTSLSEDINTGDSSPHVNSPAESLFVCPHCDSTFSELDHLNRHQTEAHKPSSTSMKCTDVQNGSKNVAGSHQVFEDLSTFLSCTAEECVFCRTKQLANKEHLRNKHLKEAVYFSDQGKEMFVVACYCKDASTNSKRSHYHCPFCQYRSFSRNFNFTKHLQVVHGITAEKKKGGKDTSLSEDINTGDSSPHVKSPAESLFVCLQCDSTFSEPDHLNRHQSEAHKPSSTSMKCTDVQNDSKNVAGSHRVFEDLTVFLSCTAEECVFCRTKQLANQEHLRNKHLKEAVYFSDQGKEKFVVACYCKDASTNSKRSHYHCPFCQYRSFSRNFNFTKHLQALHGITAEKKKGEMDTSLLYTSPIENLYVCTDCVSTFSELDRLNRHRSEAHKPGSTSMKCTDVQKNMSVFEDLSTFLSCTAEECVFCRTKQLANQEHLRNKHLKEAVYFSDQGKEMFVVACFCKDAFTSSKRSHYHCPFCFYRSFSRNFNFTKHLQRLHGITAEKNKGGNHFRDSNGKTARDRSPHTLGLFPCPHCDSSFNASSNLRRHQRDVHSLNSIPIVCVDRHTGIFVTPRYDHSPFLPIHIVKSTSPPVFGCELDSCQESMKTGRLSGNPSKECEHLLRTRYVKSYTPPAILTLESLKEMEQKGLISKEWSEQCELLHGTAAENGVDSVYPILYGDMGYSKRMMFFSVYTDKSDNWCKFGRTRVSFDSVSGKWSCQCGEAAKSHGCLHRMLSMWWIFQESPRLLLPDMEVLERAISGLDTKIFH